MKVRAKTMRCAAAGLLLAAAAAAPAWAQQPARAEAAEASGPAAAMERAQRQADNPLRMILEAGRIRRRADAETPPEPAEAARATAAQRSATAPAATAAPQPVSQPAPPPVVAQPEPVLATLTTDPSLTQPLPAAAPALRAELGPRDAPTLDARPLAVPSPELATLLVQPKLLEMVEPDLPPRLLADLGSLAEVNADLSLRADGSVAAVQLLTSVPPALRRRISEAMMRWRFEPLPADRQHRVQLVFRQGS